ncbi:MAG: fumarate hydratase C-terminal domain-containing protein [Thaumarchaeota archaeon]|nr:fumarate hydratase C-terminal domain-containing protein [Nitrososphaerota archaeon]
MLYKLETPVSRDNVRKLRVGDVIYLTGRIVSCRDACHQRLLEYLEAGKPAPIDLTGLAIYHVGPVVRGKDRKWEVISAGPTTSARMEKYEAEVIEKTGAKIIIGKGGMGDKTAEACRKFGAVYAIFPGGAGALAAKFIEEVERVEWLDLGIPEAMWIFRVRNFGPLIVTIDSTGENFYRRKAEEVKSNLEKAYEILDLKM